jgi:hypothetical protein
MQALGHPPDAPARESEWLAQVSIVAAYREQFRVATDDPAHPLGPYVESGALAHKPYSDAVESLHAARLLGGIDAPAIKVSPDAKACGQVVADIYRVLAENERIAISIEMTRRTAMLWPGRPTRSEDETTNPAFAAALIGRGHMKTAAGSAHPRPMADESEEAEPVRRGSRHGSAAGVGRLPTARPTPAPRPEPMVRPAAPAQPGPQHHY